LSFLSCLALLLVAPAPAQEEGPRVAVGKLDLDTYRAALAAERRAIMEANIGLDPERRLRFFTVYAEYEKEREPVDVERFSLLQRYAAAKLAVSEPQAMALARAVAGLQIKEIQLRSRYADRIAKELGGLVGARFYQVDDVVTTAHRLNALQSIPLTGAPATAR
jgi:hypothetical protein